MINLNSSPVLTWFFFDLSGLVHGPTMVGPADARSGAFCAVRAVAAARTAQVVGWSRHSEVLALAQRLRHLQKASESGNQLKGPTQLTTFCKSFNMFE